MEHYISYIRGKLSDAGESLCYLVQEARKNGGPYVPSDYQRGKLMAVAFEVIEAKRCLGVISTEEDSQTFQREMVSLEKKLGYLGDHIVGLLCPDKDHEALGKSHGINSVPWKIFQQIVSNYRQTTQDLLKRWPKTKTL